MSYVNGRLPDSVLAPIPGGRLRKDAAAAWNAMCAEAVQRGMAVPQPTSPRVAYRTLAEQQYFWELYKSGRGNLAAVPGTSNHGWGLAVDVATQAQRQTIDRIGEKYGWAKKWSDAPSEWWHLKWREGDYPAVKAHSSDPTLKRGQVGPSVIRAKKLLYDKGLRGFGSRFNPYFSRATASAVRRFQLAHDLKGDGVIGAATWKALKS